MSESSFNLPAPLYIILEKSFAGVIYIYRDREENTYSTSNLADAQQAVLGLSYLDPTSQYKVAQVGDVQS